MNLALIGPSKLRYMTYMKQYLDILEEKDCAAHVIYWDRDGVPEQEWAYKATFHVFREDIRDDWPHYKKIIPFLKFRRYIRDVLKETKCKKVVFFQTVTGLSIFNYLVNRYSKNYIFDYRDIDWTQKIAFLKKATAKLVQSSALTFISSDGFRDYLQKSVHIVRMHNVDGGQLEESLSFNRLKNNPRNGDCCKVAFWGNLRHGVIDNEALAAFGCDKRFEFHFYGAAPEMSYYLEMKKVVEDGNFDNIFFHGLYSSSDRKKFVDDVDLLWNCYYFDNGAYNPAVSNKYYDGIMFRIPQVVFKNSFSGKEVPEKELGVAIDPSEPDYLDVIYLYWTSVNYKKFDIRAKKEIVALCRETSEIERLISEFAC